MNDWSEVMSDAKFVLRRNGEGERRWFFGGGIHTWKATAEETDGAFLLFEDHMAPGKMTPVHTHPADESFYVLDGEITVHIVDEGEEYRLGAGDFAVVLRGVAHAFMTTAETRLLCLQTPGDGQNFFRHASQPIVEGSIDGPVDFDRVRAAGKEHGGVDFLGPPPFVEARR